ncbi:unnamed protein product [Macrosiphum euphorbiae]|uniref:Ribosomal protein L2 n=1 Tax=Macrosiphum euphorbiae TaxID=13131 RepID=A0AAV0XFC9_9HEMI|nr:unnamed protein product [Macrosiphum euphorbiae]
MQFYNRKYGTNIKIKKDARTAYRIGHWRQKSKSEGGCLVPKITNILPSENIGGECIVNPRGYRISGYFI